MTEETRKKMMERVRALLAKTVENGCSEAEAMASLAKAQAIMSKFDIDHADLQFGNEEVLKESYECLNRNIVPRYMASAIARFCNCKVWNNITGQRTRAIVFFGLESDVVMAKWLMAALDAFVNRASERHLKNYKGFDAAFKRQQRNGFVLGCTTRISERLNELAKMNADQTPIVGGKALIIVKNAVVDKAFAELNMNFRKAHKGKRRCSESGYEAGKREGDKANFNRPVSGANVRRISGY